MMNSIKKKYKNKLKTYEYQKYFLKPQQNWEELKLKIKKISKQFSIVKAEQRKTDITICKEMKQRNFPDKIIKNIKN